MASEAVAAASAPSEESLEATQRSYPVVHVPPAKDYTTHLVSYRYVPLAEWQRHPPPLRANETSSLNPIARPPIHRMNYATTYAEHKDYFTEKRDDAARAEQQAQSGAAGYMSYGDFTSSAQLRKYLAASGAGLRDDAVPSKAISSVAEARENVRKAAQRLKDVERFFAAEARYGYSITATKPVGAYQHYKFYPEGRTEAGRAPCSSSSSSSASSASSSTPSGSSTVFTPPAEVFARIAPNKASRVLSILISDKSAEAAHKLGTYKKTVYPPDFTPAVQTITSNLSAPSPWLGKPMSESQRMHADLARALAAHKAQRGAPVRYNFMGKPGTQ